MADDDRDKRRAKTPPVGVRAQIAPSRPESWEDEQTGQTPVDGSTETTIEKLERRSKHTRDLAHDAKSAAVTTLDRIAVVDKRVDNLETKVDDIGKAVQEQGKQNKEIIGMTSDVISILKGRETVTTTVSIAETEVKKQRAITDLELAKAAGLQTLDERKVRSDLRRQFWMNVLKVFGVVCVAVGSAVAASLAQCGAP